MKPVEIGLLIVLTVAGGLGAYAGVYSYAPRDEVLAAPEPQDPACVDGVDAARSRAQALRKDVDASRSLLERIEDGLPE